ncbi:MAG TPA: hypothetical protein VK503_05525, partial [Candidatus Bathyarchaeia archaeon]|nr:hypothetical protein [Candidatus Bathyarchaeia archaeon]
MATQDQAQNTFELLLKQYEQCWADRRNYDSMIWHTPTISLTIIAVLLASVISQKFTIVPSRVANAFLVLIVFSFAFAVSFVGTIQLKKQRFFADIRTAELRCIEYFWLRHYVPQYAGIVFRTSDVIGNKIHDVKVGSLDRFRAFNWFYGLMVVVS